MIILIASRFMDVDIAIGSVASLCLQVQGNAYVLRCGFELGARWPPFVAIQLLLIVAITGKVYQ